MRGPKLATVVICAFMGTHAIGRPMNAAAYDLTTQEELLQLKAELSPYARGVPHPVGLLLAIYLRFYGLEIGGTEYSIGTLESAGHTIVLQTFAPPASRGVVVLAHGYYDHAASLKHLIRHLVAEGYTVAAYDQPGHGFSGGAPGSIDSFVTYAAVLSDVVQLLRRDFGGPFHFVGFSLGGAAAIELLTGSSSVPVEGVVLIAPLVRASFWNVSLFGFHLAGEREILVRRVFGRNSSDRAYLEFVRNDPLQVRFVSRTWFGALVTWNEELETRGPSDMRILVVQGTADGTVAWRYNLRALRRLFPAATVKMVRGARHQLPNESEPVRQEVFAAVTDYLATVGTP